MLRKVRILILLLVMSTGHVLHAQNARISGKVFNKNNEPVVGALVKVGSNTSVSTDVDGRFQIKLAKGTYTIIVSHIGYDNTVIDSADAKDDPIDLQVFLQEKTKNLQDVIVQTRSTKRLETVNALIQFQKNTSSVAQVISAEAIKRSPDRNTGEALKRVTGLSLQDGKYIIVRGLNDRYNQAMLDGVLLSSTEPDRKAFSFDIIPSSIIDNIIIDKTFVPEYSAEWAGGLIHVNTKDIPTRNFLNVQIGTNLNTNTIGKDFYSYPGSGLDWLGFDDGKRALPSNFPTKSQFSSPTISPESKLNFGKELAAKSWAINKKNSLTNYLGQSFQLNGGYVTKLFNKDLGASYAFTYNRTPQRLSFDNGFYTFEGGQSQPTFNYHNEKYSQNVLWGALANVALKINNNNKISFKNLLNVNTTNFTTVRNGMDYDFNAPIKAQETGFANDVLFNTQVSGEHNIATIKTKIDWYGSFGIMDQYIPDQRRLQYNQDPDDIYRATISNTLSQSSGNIFYSNLSDYLYNAGGNITNTFKLFGHNQIVKAGYNFQVKDRLYDARPFSVVLPQSNTALKGMDPANIFNASNFGTADNMFHVEELSSIYFRYMANTILNATYLQLDNNFTDWLRVVWGVRYENYDQLVGSKHTSDPRYNHSKKGDFLPALNATFKLNRISNLRAVATQTLVRPEFRELIPIAFYNFEIGATVIGNPNLIRTKVTNLDLRYEIYPHAGELLTIGAFYKNFKNPIELGFNQTGAGSTSFNYLDNSTLTAKAYGVEIEIRKKLDFVETFRNFTAFGNYSWIHNRVKSNSVNLDRPMQGQSPYVINVGLQYDHPTSGFSSTVLFNQIGRRILYVGNDQVAPVWEAPRPLLDFQIAQKVMKKQGELRLSVSNIINGKANFYYDLNKNNKYDKSSDPLALSRNYGTNISLTFNYTIK